MVQQNGSKGTDTGKRTAENDRFLGFSGNDGGNGDRGDDWMDSGEGNALIREDSPA
ncbi:MAG TPA: hypothetical protein V6C57_23795 [Coleofasciculaceae cyanobacterium]